MFDSVNGSKIMVFKLLANKWNLTSIVDSDGDGWTDAAEIAADSDPADDTSLAISYPDFSDAVDAEIGTSDLDSIEGNLVLWLDAENINGENNAGLTDNQAIDRWFDMSENGNNMLPKAGGSHVYDQAAKAIDLTNSGMGTDASFKRQINILVRETKTLQVI